MNYIKQRIRAVMHRVAGVLDRLSGGRLTPNMVTWIGFVMHLPIAYLIATNYNRWAAILLVVFGLFDTLDGELARLQKRASPEGMLLDASTDRMKEVLLYGALAYAFSRSTHPAVAALATWALGASLCVSYVKAKGEAALASGSRQTDHHSLNRLFADGLLPFEVRMALLVIGLLVGGLTWIVAIIAIGATLTAFQRLYRITKYLHATN